MNCKCSQLAKRGCLYILSLFKTDALLAQKIPSKLEVAPPPKCGLGEWVIPLRLLRLQEHLAVLINGLQLVSMVRLSRYSGKQPSSCVDTPRSFGRIPGNYQAKLLSGLSGIIAKFPMPLSLPLSLSYGKIELCFNWEVVTTRIIIKQVQLKNRLNHHSNLQEGWIITIPFSGCPEWDLPEWGRWIGPAGQGEEKEEQET